MEGIPIVPYAKRLTSMPAQTRQRYGSFGKLRAGVMAISASVLSTSLLLVGAAAVAAVTCNVPGSHATIQAAVDDPSCDTIQVAPGAYPENVVVDRTVEILGSPGATVTGSFTVEAPNVNIDGFSINNPGQLFGIRIKTAGSGSVISNNTLSQIGDSALGEPTVAIYLELGPDNVSVLDNDITAVASGTRSAQGILVGDSTSSDPSLDILIQGNTITNITSATRGAYGIQVNNGASTAPTATGFATVEIRDNTIDGLTGGGWAHAIGLEGETPTAVVEDNSISNLVDATPAPINDAIAVFFEANPGFATAEVHTNNFNLTAAQYGIAVHPFITGAGEVDGTCNWWNSPTGPTHTGNPGGTGAQA